MIFGNAENAKSIALLEVVKWAIDMNLNKVTLLVGLVILLQELVTNQQTSLPSSQGKIDGTDLGMRNLQNKYVLFCMKTTM
ncbi:hypothetical protein BVC80_8707g14 [Macleaya cordata]|uniref:Uncharacterized protein n=1 Tax=Macleaya cordata TaxID=56857 RepID=A0A200Q118_MACCD|nr:hypothetical protein BVC80_8707g14 [Macleaya cordata]